jgi:hypothetical protein
VNAYFEANVGVSRGRLGRHGSKETEGRSWRGLTAGEWGASGRGGLCLFDSPRLVRRHNNPRCRSTDLLSLGRASMFSDVSLRNGDTFLITTTRFN